MGKHCSTILFSIHFNIIFSFEHYLSKLKCHVLTHMKMLDGIDGISLKTVKVM